MSCFNCEKIAELFGNKLYVNHEEHKLSDMVNSLFFALNTLGDVRKDQLFLKAKKILYENEEKSGKFS